MMIEKVSFAAQGDEMLVGDLHLPDGDGPFPGIVLIGPMTFCKEQAPSEYAKRLAMRGYAALAFDTRIAARVAARRAASRTRKPRSRT